MKRSPGFDGGSTVANDEPSHRDRDPTLRNRSSLDKTKEGADSCRSDLLVRRFDTGDPGDEIASNHTAVVDTDDR